MSLPTGLSLNWALLRLGKFGIGKRDVLCIPGGLIDGDKDIAEFLEAPEKDGFYHLYVVHEDKVDDADRRLVYGPGVGFYTDSESTSGRCSDMASNRGESSVNGLDFYPNQINP